MHGLVDADDAVGNLTQIEKDLSEAVTLRQAVEKPDVTTAPAPAATTAAPTVPEKYRGKSVEEIIQMHQNAESALGRMANDLGTQRKLTDRLLDVKRNDDLQRNGGHKLPQVTSAELLEKPTETLERFTSAQGEQLVSGLKQDIDSLRGEIHKQNFVAKHPDYQDLANDQEFVRWVQLSPYRSRAAVEAYKGDWVAADELMSEFKAARPKTAPVNEPARKPATNNMDAARAAALESSNTSGDAGGKKAGKILRRADLIRLRVEKPDVYYSDDMQREIMLAYAEDRVK